MLVALVGGCKDKPAPAPANLPPPPPNPLAADARVLAPDAATAPVATAPADAAPGPPTANSAPRTLKVEIRAMKFVPATLDVAVGDTVVWTNHDVVAHTVTSIVSSPLTFDSRSIDSNQTWSLKVTKPGELAYECSFHPTMTAKLVAK
ncbi:MAG: plastocyanin/azurin family copper-binding protein [Kofleriaceae bacterium]